MCAVDVTEELCASECLCVRVSGEIMNISVWVRLCVCVCLCVCMPVACWVSICMCPITCLSVLLCVLRENNRLNVHVSVQDSSLRERKREKWLGNGVFPAVIRESIALALCTSPCLRFVHMPPLLAVGEGCVCVCICMRSFRGVEALGREQADLVSWPDPRKHSQQCNTLRRDEMR